MKHLHLIRSFTAVLLVLGISLSITFSWYYYLHEKAEWAKQRQALIQNGLLDDLLIRMEFTHEELEEVSEGDHEVIINGAYYDVISQQEIEGKVVLQLVVDEEEENIEKRFRSYINRGRAHSQLPKNTHVHAGLLFAKALMPSGANIFIRSVRPCFDFCSDVWSGNQFHPSIPSSPPDAG